MTGDRLRLSGHVVSILPTGISGPWGGVDLEEEFETPGRGQA